jgi:23S rRNA (cytosine1962-C5)-methyltransferase
MEGLSRRRGVLLPAAPAGEAQTLVRYHDAGALLEADLLADGKTGGFLDQQENHALALGYAQGVAEGGGRTGLDAFTYHGGFALALARGGLETMACDESAAAIGRARRNAELNGLAVDFQVRNAFDLLRALEASGRRFDMVVIDPPALAKRGQAGASAVAAAVRAYKELNLRGLRLLSPGGVLITCSCSARVGGAEFGAMLEAAAHDAGAPVQVLERRGAGRDHPVLLGVPETEYLKCWVLRRAL